MNPTLQQNTNQSVLWATTSYTDLQTHCTCYLHLMGSTAILSIHHRTPYTHISMSYTSFSPALSLGYRILYFSELSGPVSSSIQQG